VLHQEPEEKGEKDRQGDAADDIIILALPRWRPDGKDAVSTRGARAMALSAG
jgi:hypothetical protein